MPSFSGQLSEQQIADVAAYVVRVDARLILPDGLPARRRGDRVRPRPHADRQDGVLRPRTTAALARRARGRDPRRHRHRPHVPLGAPLRRGGRDRGRRSSATRARSSSTRSRGELLRHEPIPLELAREAIAAVEAEGFALNCYVDDELYVAAITEHARGLRRLPEPPGARGRRPARLARAAADEARRRRRPGRARRARGRACGEQFGERLYIAKSLPYFLELASPASRRAAGSRSSPSTSASRAEQTVAFGDGENDVELLEWAGYGVAVENAHDVLKARADWVCPLGRGRGRRAGARGAPRLRA